MPPSRPCSAMIFVALVAAFLALNAGQAAAASPACGDTISVDTTLHADLIDCANDGIVIGADNITLNLNGHTIDGDATASDCPDGTACDTGIRNLAAHDRVTVQGGTVREFAVGVFFSGGDRSRLRDLSVSRNGDFGIIVENSTNVAINRNSLTDNGTSALLMADSRYAVVARNHVSGSGGYAVPMFGVDDSIVENNTLDRNAHGILGDGTSRNTIQHNSVTHGGGSSIDIGGGAANNRIVRNRLIDDGDGIVLAGEIAAHDNLISHNTVTRAGLDSPDSGGFGLILDGADRNTVDNNTITGGRGPAIYVTSLEAPTASEDNVLSRNVANSRFSDGILVDNAASGTLIQRNIANRNGLDGIHVNAPATKLTRNIANRNHDLGIEAVFGVTDGGGNRAARNGNALQCVNLAC